MEPFCNDMNGDPIKPGDLLDVTDDEGKTHRVRLTGFTTHPVHHPDGTREYSQVDVEKIEGGILWHGIAGTKRVKKVK
jgi:hypothetical protein